MAAMAIYQTNAIGVEYYEARRNRDGQYDPLGPGSISPCVESARS
jgi:hypothetical protein